MNIVWFRNDLRSRDNPALYAAAQQGPCLGVFFVCMQQWQAHGHGANKIVYLRESLLSLQKNLARLNIPLLVIEAGTFAQVAGHLLALCKKQHANQVFYNQEYELNEHRRDQQVNQLLHQQGIHCHSFHDQCLIAPGQCLTQQGHYYSVFTPFKRAWLQKISTQYQPPLPAPKTQTKINVTLPAWPDNFMQLKASADLSNTPCGERLAHQQLEHFIQTDLHNYQAQRDFPALNATSHLSSALACGVLSLRQCLHGAVLENNGEFVSGRSGPDTWISELIWREFYKHIIFGFSHINRGQAFKTETDKLPWLHNSAHLQAWQSGNTGYPLVDAAMRQLLHTGWMHNRLRMVTAMFFSKNLMLDWRLGEHFFMQHLTDGDFAANNGGWQWSASTGVDAAPYFRMFNPTAQSEKFDPNGDFIRTWVPELRELSKKQIHNPSPELRERYGYSQPIVDYAQSRARVLGAFKTLYGEQHG